MEQEKSEEIWRNVPGCENYQASNMGRVRSLDRTVVRKDGSERFYKGRIIGSNVKKDGYKQAGLSINGQSRVLKVSQIVAMTFLNHIPDGHNIVVDHINGDKSDDRVENLRIVTQRENSTTCFRKDSKNLTSEHVGVSWNKSTSKWASAIYFEGIVCSLGQFDSELEASKSYQNALDKIDNGVFNPDEYKPKLSSSYKGVCLHKSSNKWVSYVWVNGKNKHLGLFNTELEAYSAIQKFKQEVKYK